jgi:glycosyltransferase involved in cell wall biosynthesis
VRPTRAAAARNQGARETGGDVLFFAEADGYYSPDYLRVCLRALGDERVGASLALGCAAGPSATTSSCG